MKNIKWQLLLGISLVTLSAIFYLIHYALFRDAYHIFYRLIGDIAFVFIEVLLVTLIIHEVLAVRERKIILERLNMVIGSFFSVVGKDLLKFFSEFDPNADRIRRDLIITNQWSAGEFLDMSKRLKKYDYAISIRRGDLGSLKQKLVKEREFMMRLLENQNLLEHDAFTSLLMSVFHLAEELESRPECKQPIGAGLEAHSGRHAEGLQPVDLGMAELHEAPAGKLSVSLFLRHENESLRPECLAGDQGIIDGVTLKKPTDRKNLPSGGAGSCSLRIQSSAPWRLRQTAG